MSVPRMIYRLCLLAVCVGLVALGLTFTLASPLHRRMDSGAPGLLCLGLYGMLMLTLEAADLLKGQRVKAPGDQKQGEEG